MSNCVEDGQRMPVYITTSYTCATRLQKLSLLLGAWIAVIGLMVLNGLMGG
jgi:hypothetical protein